jgi:hypothetical protein
VQALARQLAGELAILEVHLHPAREVPDFAVLVKETAQLAAVLESFPARLQAFLDRWGEERDPRLPSLWLEFDLPGASGVVPVPNFCAKVRETAEHRWVVAELLPRLNGGPLTSWQQEAAVRCLRAIPATAQLIYAFNLLPRGGDLRLEVFGLQPAEIVAYLARIGAPVPPDEVAGVATLFAGIERTHLSFDLGADGIRPRIGLEGSFARLTRREPRWGELLDGLGRWGLCSPEQREALLAWTGWDSFWTAPDIWPRGPAGMDAFCIRFLSHVKVAYQPGRPLEAKAYLAFGPHRRHAGREPRTGDPS